MDAVGLVNRAYNVGKCKRRCAMSCFGSACCKDEQSRLKKLHIFKKWPKISEPDEPDNIKWENLGVKKAERRIRVCISWLIALALIIIALGCIVEAKD